MKRKNTKKDFNKFTKVNTHKRKSKERARAEIMRILDEIDVKHDGFSYKEMSAHRANSRVRDQGAATVLGIYSGTKSGFGFVTVEGSSDADIFIPEGKSMGAIDGDYVECTYRKYKNYLGADKTEGRIVRIVKAGREQIIGRIVSESSYMRGRHRVESSNLILRHKTSSSCRCHWNCTNVSNIS